MSTLSLPAAALLAELDSLGVQVSRRGGVLDLNAPRGVLTPQVLAEVRDHKAELLQVLEAAPPRVPEVELQHARHLLGPRAPEAEALELAQAIAQADRDAQAHAATGGPRRFPDQVDAGELYRQAHGDQEGNQK